MLTLKARSGVNDVVQAFQLLDDNGDAITTYTGAATLLCEARHGPNAATLFNPTATWVDATVGKVSIRIGKAQTAGLADGLYQIWLSISAGGTVASQHVAMLSLESDTVADVSVSPYITRADVVGLVPWIEQVESLTEDSTGFYEARLAARQWFDQRVLDCDRGPNASTLASRLVFPRLQAWRTGGRNPWLVTALAANQLVVTYRVKRANALYAVAEILDAQFSADEKYQKLANDSRAEAVQWASSGVAEIDTDADGIANYLVELGSLQVIQG